MLERLPCLNQLYERIFTAVLSCRARLAPIVRAQIGYHVVRQSSTVTRHADFLKLNGGAVYRLRSGCRYLVGGHYPSKSLITEVKRDDWWRWVKR